jgi:DNA-binding IclR family transcriptional regulator
MRTADWTNSVSVLDRVSAILDAFDGMDDGFGISDLARRANLPKSTVSRLAAELVEHRILDREGDRFHLGLRLFELGLSVEEPRRLRQAALPIMSELRNVTGQSVRLVLRDGADAVTLAVVRGGAPSPGRVGERSWVFASAQGRALVAHAPTEVVSSALASAPAGGPRLDPGDMRQALAQIRATGLARGLRHDPDDGQLSVATPVMAPGSGTVAALAVAGASHSDVADVAPHLRAAATRLEKSLRND